MQYFTLSYVGKVITHFKCENCMKTVNKAKKVAATLTEVVILERH